MCTSSKPGKPPLITVAIPTKDNASTIGTVLKSLYAQDYPRNRIQVVFVDGLSKDGTHKRISGWIKKNRKMYSDISIVAEQSNIPTARNICLSMAKGKYVLFWDADVIAPPPSIKDLLNHLKDPKIAVANYPYYPEKPSLIDKVLRTDEPTKLAYVKAVVMGFTMIRKEIITKVGYFNEKLDGFEDQEFSRRVIKAKFKIVMDPSVRLKHLKKSHGLGHFVIDNFSRRSKYVNALVRTGSKIHVLRAAYYVLLPINFLAGWVLADFFSWKIGLCVLGTALVYTLLSIVWHLREVRRSSYGFLSPVVHLIGGIALAYGMLWQAAKEK